MQIKQKNLKHVTTVERQATLRRTAGWHLLQATELMTNYYWSWVWYSIIKYITIQEDLTATPTLRLQGRVVRPIIASEWMNEMHG